MNEDRIVGTARNIDGKVEEGVGPRIFTGKPPKWRGTPPSPLKNGCGTPLRPSPMQR
jgi:hypothetical protein